MAPKCTVFTFLPSLVNTASNFLPARDDFFIVTEAPAFLVDETFLAGVAVFLFVDLDREALFFFGVVLDFDRDRPLFSGVVLSIFVDGGALPRDCDLVLVGMLFFLFFS